MMLWRPPDRSRRPEADTLGPTRMTVLPASNPPSPSRRWWPAIAERLGPLAALFLLIALATWVDKGGSFLTVGNFLNILRQNSFVGIVALGMTFVIILGGIDLSVGSMVALLGGVGIMMLNKAGNGWELSPWLAITIAGAVMITLGMGLGLINGLVISVGRITPFIATLGGMAMFRSLALVFADGGEYRAGVPGFDKLGSGWVNLPISYVQAGADAATSLRLHYPTMAFFALAAVLSVVLSRTTFGRRVYAIGDNEKAALYSGIKLGRTRIATYALVGGLCGMTALLVSARMNSVSSAQTGLMYELDAIAAVVVGGASMRGGRGRIFGTVVGVLILGVVNNMLNMISSSETLTKLGLANVSIAHLQGLVKGLIIIAAVMVQRGRQ